MRISHSLLLFFAVVFKNYRTSLIIDGKNLLDDFFFLDARIGELFFPGGVLVDLSRRMSERVDLKRQAFGFERLRDYVGEQLLFEFGDFHKFCADARTGEFIKRLADERQKIAARQTQQNPKFVARVDVFVKAGQAAADADLMKHNRVPFAGFVLANRWNVERKSDMASLFD